ncbi:MAG: TauD/TfdA family dioxygenase [Rhodospirillaceae bacterium]|nr:TauD/TfdA family dioxygenase [Rhodospirillaceae bacterium]MBT5809665.1 TauD/TfdA family dioxygenase [Rhodospirillaceae bacterium]
MATMREHPFSSPMTWAAETLLADDGRIALDGACLAELDRVAVALRDNPLPIEVLDPVDFDMPACRAAMVRAHEQIANGIGFAIIDRLPVEGLEIDVAKKLYWLLMSMVSRPVAQKWDGEMIYDVTDTGKKALAGSGVRSSKTNGGQSYHTDNAFNLPPDFVALFCLQTARKGGISGLVSLETVYNLLLAEFPDVLPRLYEPFYFDRQMEHAPDDDVVSVKPVFESDGERLYACFSPRRVEHGFELRREDMDASGRAAIDALMRVPERPGLGKTFEFERGQIQIVNNRRLGHRRTSFRDWPEPERRRHLVRIWLRESGRPFYLG